jgi:internalin A
MPNQKTNLSAIRISQMVLEKIRDAKKNNSELLNLSRSYLTSLPEEIFKLSKLRSLNLSHNELSILPESITQLKSLEILYLNDNQFSTIPKPVTQLQNLTILDCSYNVLGVLPESFTQLQNLTHLDLSHNELGTLTESITRLRNLTFLDFSHNLLVTIPESISRLQKLIKLYLNDNQISMVPGSTSYLQNLEVLDLHNNPLITPPIEIADNGIAAIYQYFQQLNQQGEDYLYEAKLLILGEGGAGKTTFANKIRNTDYVLKDEESTKGVDVNQWDFPMGAERKFRVNIWDFGGQEIYHATHQFFLTRRSLYTLVADTRKDDTDFYYWLNVAELLGDSSPLLIIKNEKQDRHREINERLLKGQFDCLREVLATNLANNRGLEKVRHAIEHYIQQLPHIGTPLPKNWVSVRKQLESDTRNYISLDEYIKICKVNGFKKIQDILQLSGYLNDIGVFLHFQDDPLLKKTVILKPRWGTDAVYKVLDNPSVISDLGRFTRSDLDAIWDELEYEDMRDELLQLMMKFRLCYEIPTQRGSYIAPQLLTENQPDYHWNRQDNLLLRYGYEFMPKGILTQFIVVMHPYIHQHKTVWKSGVVIEKDNTRAEVIEYYGRREIHIRVEGVQIRELMTVIRYELKQIHDSYKRLKYDELIRCNCPACRESQDPHFYTVAKLLEFKADNQLQIQCQKKPYHMVNVLGLLGDVIDLSRLSEKDEHTSVYVQGDYIEGDKKMTEKDIHIEGSTVYGSVVAAETIQDSFNVINNSSAQADLKEQLKLLAQAVDAMVKGLPKEKAEEAADDMKRLAEEAIKEKPNPKWYNVSIDGLVAAAQNLGKVGDAVIKLVGKVRKILTG